MILVRYFDKSDLFVIFTVNPRWKETTDTLFLNQIYTDRPDIIVRVFRTRLKRLIYLIRIGAAFGPYRAYIYTIEYQKRGLSYTYIIVFIHAGHVFFKLEYINNLIRVKFFNRQLNPDKSLTVIIKQTLIYGFYNPLNLISLYIIKKYLNDSLICIKRFPREFNKTIIINADGYPIYRRRRIIDNKIIIQGPNSRFNNYQIVSYNPFLIYFFKIHINVEVCITIKTVKYIYKYIYKGHDKATLQIYKIDKITRYITCRYINLTQTIQSILEFPTHKEWPTIIRLDLYISNKQTVTFSPKTDTAELR